MTDKLLKVSFVGIAVLVVNYVAYSLMVLATYNKYVNGQILFVAMLEFLTAVFGIVLYSWRVYSRVLEEKGWTQPRTELWKILRVGFVGSGFAILAILAFVIARAVRSVFVLGSIGVAGVFLCGIWMEISFILGIVENRKSK